MSIFSWFFYTIFKDLTKQIVYPKCNRMHHFTSFWKKNWGGGLTHPDPSPYRFSLSRVGMYGICVCNTLLKLSKTRTVKIGNIPSNNTGIVQYGVIINLTSRTHFTIVYYAFEYFGLFHKISMSIFPQPIY